MSSVNAEFDLPHLSYDDKKRMIPIKRINATNLTLRKIGGRNLDRTFMKQQ